MKIESGREIGGGGYCKGLVGIGGGRGRGLEGVEMGWQRFGQKRASWTRGGCFRMLRGWLNEEMKTVEEFGEKEGDFQRLAEKWLRRLGEAKGWVRENKPLATGIWRDLSLVAPEEAVLTLRQFGNLLEGCWLGEHHEYWWWLKGALKNKSLWVVREGDTLSDQRLRNPVQGTTDFLVRAACWHWREKGQDEEAEEWLPVWTRLGEIRRNEERQSRGEVLTEERLKELLFLVGNRPGLANGVEKLLADLPMARLTGLADRLVESEEKMPDQEKTTILRRVIVLAGGEWGRRQAATRVAAGDCRLEQTIAELVFDEKLVSVALRLGDDFSVKGLPEGVREGFLLAARKVWEAGLKRDLVCLFSRSKGEIKKWRGNGWSEEWLSRGKHWDLVWKKIAPLMRPPWWLGRETIEKGPLTLVKAVEEVRASLEKNRRTRGSLRVKGG